MKDRFTVSFVCMVLGTTIASAAPLDVRGADAVPIMRAWEFIERVLEAGGSEFLHRGASATPSPEFRAHLLASLPKKGELVPTRAESTKLAALEPVLAFDRRLRFVEVRVVDVGYAFAGVYAGVVLLLTREALSLVNARELQAIAAHELGHVYYQQEYGAALQAGDYLRLQELELRCDGLAVITMRELALDPADLIRAATKFARHNERLGITVDTRGQVSLEHRVAFIRRVDARLADRFATTNPDNLSGSVRLPLR